MAYHVEFVEPVRDYLSKVEGLSDAELSQVVDGVIDELSQRADYFLTFQPLSHESLCFRYDYPLSTEHRMYDFEFVVDASYLEMGVVRVVYVECTIEPL